MFKIIKCSLCFADGRKKVIVPEPDRENPTIVWRPNVSCFSRTA